MNIENNKLNLLLSELDFNPRNSQYLGTNDNDGYYIGIEDKLENMEELVDKIDPTSSLALSWYSAKVLGRRLSPTIVATRLAMREDLTDEVKDMLRFFIKSTFTNPTFIGHSLKYAECRFGKGIKKTRRFLRSAFKEQLESYSDTTLIKNKMQNREVTLADMINIFRPNPTKAIIKNKDLFKSIVSNNREDIALKDNSITAILSNTQTSEKEKQIKIAENLDTLAINSIIRNITNIECTENNMKIIERRLNEIINSNSSLRFLNPFDLILDYDVRTDTDYRWIALFDKVLVQWMKNLKLTTDEKYNIVLDISGSMSYDGATTGAKFIALMKCAINIDKVFLYNTKIVDSSAIHQLIKDEDRPNILFNKLDRKWRDITNGGTHTLEVLSEILKMDSNNVILVTDEFTFDECETLEENINSELEGKTMLLFNVSWSGNAISTKLNILRMSGLQGQLFKILPLYTNFSEIYNIIMTSFEEAYNNYKKTIDNN